MRRLGTLALSLALVGACTTAPRGIDMAARAPVLDGYGGATLQPSQGSAEARRLFAQGVAQAYAFDDQEAIRAFKAATARDPGCALCAWGVAWQMGPNINNTRRGDLGAARRYVELAQRNARGASARDRALIDALALRYGASGAAGQGQPLGGVCRSGGGEPVDPLDIAYAARMRELVAAYPQDPDVVALYAEAELVATERGWWNPETGKPTGRVGEVADLVEAALARAPEHAGLNHYMIHAVDAVPVAARAVPAADRLGRLAPKSPHLLHMPSHTYAQVGRYADATRVNALALEADDALTADLKRQGFQPLSDWRGHNGHFKWYGALMEGRAALALETARANAGRARGDSDYAEYLRSLPMLTLLHLGRWEALLAEPMPSGGRGMAAVLGDTARGIAMARTGDLAGARTLLARVQPKADALLATYTGNGYGARIQRSLVAGAARELAAEVAFTEGRVEAALALQAQAVEAGIDADRTEPPSLASAPRLRLGEMQLRAHRYLEAERSFRADLALHPLNGWALQGLGKALAAQGKQGDARATQRALAASWAQAEAAVRGAP